MGLLKVGAVMPLTGERAQTGEISKNALIMAVDDINRAGGIRGQQVSLIIEDDNDQPDLARSAAKKLISEHGVLVLIGAGSFEAVSEIEKIAQERRVPCLETSASDKEAPELDGNYVFHMVPPLS
jgi:branched-chain amino acid transport system substrate-binding protein